MYKIKTLIYKKRFVYQIEKNQIQKIIQKFIIKNYKSLKPSII